VGCSRIRQALKNIEDDPIKAAALARLELGALIYAGLPLEQERQAFRDQNLLVQRPSVSLAHTFDQRSPLVLIAKNLLDRVPQFRNNVEMVENGLGTHNPKLMTKLASSRESHPKYCFLLSLNSVGIHDLHYLSRIEKASFLPRDCEYLINPELRVKHFDGVVEK
jgi:hypothetical protein